MQVGSKLTIKSMKSIIIALNGQVSKHLFGSLKFLTFSVQSKPKYSARQKEILIKLEMNIRMLQITYFRIGLSDISILDKIRVRQMYLHVIHITIDIMVVIKVTRFMESFRMMSEIVQTIVMMIADPLKQKNTKQKTLKCLQNMHGTFSYAKIQYALIAFQQRKPTVRFKEFNKFMKIIYDSLYILFNLCSQTYYLLLIEGSKIPIERNRVRIKKTKNMICMM